MGTTTTLETTTTTVSTTTQTTTAPTTSTTTTITEATSVTGEFLPTSSSPRSTVRNMDGSKIIFSDDAINSRNKELEESLRWEIPIFNNEKLFQDGNRFP